MRLYKDGKCMMFVDADQVQICLDAGWSEVDEVAKAKAIEDAEEAKAKAIEDAKTLLEENEEADEFFDSNDTSSAPRKILKIKNKK
jgi:hypothetical protein